MGDRDRNGATASERALLVVLVSGRGSNLQAIDAAIERGRLAARIAGVVSNRSEARAVEWARERGIAVRVVDHRRFELRAAFDDAVADAIESIVPVAARRWVVLAGFLRILGAAFVERFADRIVNIHPSLLPAYPGLQTHRRALAEGAIVHGATVHLVRPDVDTGPIVAQAIVPVLPRDDEASLAARVLELEHVLYPYALGLLLEGRLTVKSGRLVVRGHARCERVLLHADLQPGLVVNDRHEGKRD